MGIGKGHGNRVDDTVIIKYKLINRKRDVYMSKVSQQVDRTKQATNTEKMNEKHGNNE